MTPRQVGSHPLRPVVRLGRTLALFALLLVGGFIAAWRVGALRPVLAGLLGRGLALLLPSQGRPSPSVLRPQDPVTALVMGTEKSPQFSGQQTDSMMVWSFDPASREAAILSVPRDLWVYIPGYGYQRINSAYELGGYRTAVLAVEDVIGVPIEYYAVVDYAAFVKLVDDVGGIDVDVPHAINDTCFPNAQENACTVFRLSQGRHHLDGATALAFVRERHSLPLADLDREANQQQVLFALKDALLQPRNLLHLPRIMADMEALVTTNLPYKDVPLLAEQVLRLPRSSIAHAVLDYRSGAVRGYRTSGGADVLLPQQAAIRRIVRQMFAPVLAHMGEATIQVENGAPTQQPLATYFTRVLAGMGARTLPARPAARDDYATSQVYWNTAAAGAGSQPPALAYMLAQMLEARLTVQSIPSSQAQIVVILGKDFPKVEP